MKILNNKKAQEEIIGFALIIIIVSIILLVFLNLSLRNSDPENVQDFEIENFLQSILEYTTDCQGDREDFRNIKELIFDCRDGKPCLDGRTACEVLGNVSKEIIEESWQIGEERPAKGYNFTIIFEDQYVLTSIIDGELSGGSRANYQNFDKGGIFADIYFEVYY